MSSGYSKSGLSEWIITFKPWLLPRIQLFINFTLLEFAAEWEDSNQSNENSTCARVRVAAKILLQNSGESSFHLQAAWSLYLWGPKRKREYGWSEESGCPFHPTVLSLVQIFCCLLWLPYDMNFPTYICKLAFSQLIILDVFCTVRTITVFMRYSQCPGHLPVLGISLHHFHPKSLCFGMQQHQYSLSEKTCSS